MNWETSNQKDTDTLIEWAKQQQGGTNNMDAKRMELFNKKIKEAGGLNLNQLGNIHTNISKLVKTKKKEEPILCDRECRQDKKKEELYRKYVLAKKKYKTAPQEYEEAKKNYYVFNKGGVWFANFLEKQSLSALGVTEKYYKNKFNAKFDSIVNVINSHSVHTKYKGHLDVMGKHYTKDANRLKKDVDDFENKKNINNRLSHYYQDQIKYINYAVKFFTWIYWALLVSFIFFIIFLQRKYMNGRIMVITIMFVIFPYFMDRVIYSIASSLTKTNVVILK